MSRIKLEAKLKEAVDQLVEEKGYVSIIDILIKLDKLSQKDYESWRRGKVGYIERVVNWNLGQLNFLLKEFRSYCLKKGLSPSWTGYHSWGKGKKRLLQFSKSGNKDLEDAYATHYVRKNKVQ
ncbi:MULTISPECIES: hypothetical protein [Bacillaceae]|uniref:Uncharacterized protein n=1 Tax=Evansella alkalicola TaxID=745819 RepID=A0ABS6JY77_9BACI|nr:MULTISPECIES: hypothetical protein [Bacillaceae]MBU9723538.1 hypothetical protein [Bacillus alkalicola]